MGIEDAGGRILRSRLRTKRLVGSFGVSLLQNAKNTFLPYLDFFVRRIMKNGRIDSVEVSLLNSFLSFLFYGIYLFCSSESTVVVKAIIASFILLDFLYNFIHNLIFLCFASS